MATTKRRDEIVRASLISAAAGGAIGAGLFAYATLVEPQWIDLHEETVRLPRLSARFDGYRIAQISDLHAGAWLPLSRLRHVVDLVNEQKPDLVVITGDFVDSTYKRARPELAPILSRLHAPDGVIGILGNHDYMGRAGPGVVHGLLKESGIIELTNRVHAIRRDNDTLYIAGVGSVREKRDKLDAVLKELPEGAAAILLAHEPDLADTTALTGRFDLQISGHSHGGQVTVPVVKPPRLPSWGEKYPAGLYRIRNMLQYTNRGLGVTGLPFRFWSRPEITVFTLRSGKQESGEASSQS